MKIAHRIELDPNNKQIAYFVQSCGVSRFSYNWALNQWHENRKNGLKTSGTIISKQLNAIKKNEFPWMYDVTKSAAQMAVYQLQDAFNRFFDNVKKKRRRGKKNPYGYPRFKKKGKKDSFVAVQGGPKDSDQNVKITKTHVYVPRLGWVRLKQSMRLDGKTMNMTISRDGHKWFASILVDLYDPFLKPRIGNEVVGVDLGVTTFAVTSNGEFIDAPKPFFKYKRKLRAHNKKLARQIEGSSNWKKTRDKIRRLHYKIKCQRNDFLHKFTTRLVLENRLIGIENLNIDGMLKNHKLAARIQDLGWGEFKRQLKYKADWYGSIVHEADRFYPSTKTCNECDHVQDMPLHVRIFECENCGMVMHRDVNAGMNLRNVAVGATETENACGETSTGSGTESIVKLESVKQEVSSMNVGKTHGSMFEHV